jgi:hypothetical protein
MARKSSIRIQLTDEERFELERRARSLTAPHRIVVRAKAILMLADEQTVSATGGGRLYQGHTGNELVLDKSEKKFTFVSSHYLLFQ